MGSRRMFPGEVEEGVRRRRLTGVGRSSGGDVRAVAVSRTRARASGQRARTVQGGARQPSPAPRATVASGRARQPGSQSTSPNATDVRDDGQAGGWKGSRNGWLHCEF
jgi:hypothetical protein